MLPQTSWQLHESEMALAHTPVLVDELLESLRPAEGEVAVDCTFGAGGHSAAVAARLGSTGLLMAIDRDPSVVAFFTDVVHAAPCACRFYQGNFADVLQVLESGRYLVSETITRTVPFRAAGEALTGWAAEPAKVTKIHFEP